MPFRALEQKSRRIDFHQSLTLDDLRNIGPTATQIQLDFRIKTIN